MTQEAQHQTTPQADLYQAAEAAVRSGRDEYPYWSIDEEIGTVRF
jgi:hypothetical protein